MTLLDAVVMVLATVGAVTLLSWAGIGARYGWHVLREETRYRLAVRRIAREERGRGRRARR